MNLSDEILRYSSALGYIATVTEAIECRCGCESVNLFSDDESGGAYVLCPLCGCFTDILNSGRYIESASQNVCLCEHELLRVSVARAFYEGTDDPRWTYVAAQCSSCGMAGVYTDWAER